MAWNCSALFHKCLRRGGTGREGGEGKGGCGGVRGGPLRRRCHQMCAPITTCSLQCTFTNQTSHHLCRAVTRLSPIIAPSVRLPCITLFIVQRSVFQQHVVCGSDLPPLEQILQQMQPRFYSYWHYFHRQRTQDQFNPMSPLFQIPSFCAYCWLLKSSHFAAAASLSQWK